MLRSIFGEVSWKQPAWLLRLGPRRVAFGIAATAVIAYAAYAAWQYFDSLPKPPQVVASATAPGITPIVDGQLVPGKLFIDFDVVADPRTPSVTVESVARIDLIGERVVDGISIQPAIEGEWRWSNEKRLSFVPAVDWPAGQRYTIRFEESVFAPGLLFESKEVEIETPAFAVSLDELIFYQDPADRDIRKVVATLSFSHPVGEESLQRKLALSMRESGANVTQAEREIGRTIDYDNVRRKAYIHSDIIQIPPHENYLKLRLDSGLAPEYGPSRTEEDIIDSVRIPDVSSYFRTRAVRSVIARDEDDTPQQTLMFEFTDQVRVDALQHRLKGWLLPRELSINGQQVRNRYWQSPREVTAEVLAQATPVSIKLNPTEREAAELHSATIDVPEYSYIYIGIEQGLESEGGFVMSVPFDTVVRGPAYPREVRIARNGAIVPLTGDHKLTFVSRGVKALKIDIGRLIDSEVNHLASQTGGDIGDPRFNNYRFNEENLTVRSSRLVDLQPGHPRDAVYSSLDLSEFLPDGGYYFIDVHGWDRATNTPVGGSDRRFVLITDLGLLIKTNHDASQDIFLHSIATGQPIGGARVQLLGKNGIPIFERTTSADGHADMPATSEFGAEKTPTVYVVRYGADSIFMPVNRSQRRLQYSRFDIGGEQVQSYAGAEQLRAQLFSDRGIYRPGDTVNLAAIVKGDDWHALGNLPLELLIQDPRGQTVLQTKIRLPDGGLFDTPFTSTAGSATGDYAVTLYLIDGNERRRSIGQTSFKIEEFQPDRLKIRSVISGQKPRGWIKPADLYAEVTLENLFGTPAQSRRIKGELELRPSNITISAFPDFTFTDPLREAGATLTTVRQTLPETTTDDNGKARLPLNVSQYDKGIYALSVSTEGFEEGGGRSVRSRASVMMSPLDKLLGYKASGNLNWIDRESEQFVELIAVDSDTKAVALDDLTLRLDAQRYVSTLVRRPNGTYAYQSVSKTETVSETPLAVEASGTRLALPTDEAGTFLAVITDDNGLAYGRIRYTVAGARNLAGNLERNAELELTLKGSSFEQGETIEMEITAPYTGAGLITIERDRVYAWKWFDADSTTSVQSIEVPAGIEGNAYVNVAFVRDLDSPEIFVSPLSYAVQPFALNRSARTIDIEVSAPELVIPGDTLEIEYRSSRDARIIVYAVDEGILQVARYQVPRPLDFFLPKMALQVSTLQMVDLILPRFEAFMRSAAPGGGEAAGLAGQNLNPFRRKAEPPVTFWSGVVEAGPTTRKLSFDVPDYFNGRLRLMAIAVADDGVGRYVDATTVRGPFVITPNLLTAVAPGDEFDVTVGVANNLEESGDDARVELVAVPSDHLQIVGEASTSLLISEGSEDRTRFRVRALEKFGNAKLEFTASANGQRARRSATLSVRPSVAYVSTAVSGTASDDPVSVDLPRRLHPQFAKQSAAASNSPLVLADGMLGYLEAFPHGCTEQIVSKVFPQLGFLETDDSSIDHTAIRQAFLRTVQSLRTRQLPQGGFRFWPGGNEPADFPSVYLLHFLTDAREQLLPVPPDMLKSGLDYVRQVAGRDVSDEAGARLRAYAIYVLTRNGYVTTNYLTNLHETLDREQGKEWRSTLTAAYMAASYSLLKQERLGEQLAGEYEMAAGDEMRTDFDTRLGRDSQYVYLLAKHFPQRLQTVSAQDIRGLIEPVMRNRFNTLSASYSILALRAYTDAVNVDGAPTMSLSGDAAGNIVPLATAAATVRAKLEQAFDSITISGHGDTPAFYVVSQTGFDAVAPQDAKAQGLEIYREYLDKNGKVISEATIGEEITVRLRVRSTGRFRSNVAVVDLLPGGFEVLRESIRNSYNRWSPDFKDVREDRVVFYGGFGSSLTEFSYRVKLTSSGSFVVPSAFAGSMYDRTVEARTKPGRFEVNATR